LSSPTTGKDLTVPKIKTHQATAKRFKVTGEGKLRRRKQGSSHLKCKKSKRSKPEMRKDVKIDPVNVKRIERLLGKRLRVD
jgi:large subunit ribosomal protein L35